VSTPKQIGITGGIGSGKSMVCRIFSALGIPVYDADSRAKSVMTTDGIVISQIKKEFGVLSYYANGTLNREHLAEAFKSPEKLKLLNEIVHPRVGYDYKQWVDQQYAAYIIKEAALLFEAKSNLGLDKTIMVYAPMELRIKRVLQRDAHRTRQQVEAIISNQMPDEEKMKLADYIITNDETQLVIPQVVALHNQFLKQS
jgi:dephospho-CoA kinase